ncbi:MAG: site-specific DNA-methyltransferase [Gammaproteobacteria bacterium]|nr:site-specific DNA-methyltransferase [Gammaproteobacteria bacterium]MBU0849348.1 site-specific DNA-methyltransferase [Gammaproteobacteria bacterium]MBU1779631.1 site-specific DNA-methyltransferase [Gammaproteobacteria bacterium]MBU2088531.1 site-specific DNA-methyltransferase [Gammaproteobacteria bacterium]MBU2128505.1 site-specific DNA-methyltransferase [Gammaproteobacteria bacterium]
MNDLFHNEEAKSGPVECLGQKFLNDDARREHYLKLLAEKLKDPAFRKIEGFPIGSDENILELSDPPYYTACPNPFIEDFVKSNGRPYQSTEKYSKEPFTSDVSEGKNDPIYTAHSYHTKVPHKAIMRYILHYTMPGDFVLDGFAGTGMTGVAARLCGDKAVVESLGYKVDQNKNILAPVGDNKGAPWVVFSKLGERHAILNDLSTAATYISHNYNSPIDVDVQDAQARDVIRRIETEFGWMFQTLHHPSDDQINSALSEIDLSGHPKLNGRIGRINYTVWSDTFSCPECASEIIYWDTAVDKSDYQVKEEFDCPSCGKHLGKKSLDRLFITQLDPVTGEERRSVKRRPALIHYSVGKSYFTKRLDAADLALIEKIEALPITRYVPSESIPKGDKTSDPLSVGITKQHHFYTRRNLEVLAAYRDLIRPLSYAFNLTSTAQVASLMYRFRSQNGSLGAGGGPMNGTLYVPSLIKEIPAIKLLKEHIEKTFRMKRLISSRGGNVVSTGSMGKLYSVKDASLDYIFVDPPFGGNLMYSELNFLTEGWLGVRTNSQPEAIENKSQTKTLDAYRRLMTGCFEEAFRVLKPGRWMTVEFSNSQAAVWNAIQTALQEAGFVVANVSALDKKQGSFNAVNNKTSVKQDLVISAYKPNGGLEDRFAKTGGSEDSVWDFVRTHLQYLPTVKTKNGELEFISERDPRIIFDRMVAWFFRHNVQVPMSTHEFQSGLIQRFVERDGMVFLPDQVTEYDKKRMQVAIAPQMEMFVSDERSAIDWLTDFLKRRPSTYQEVHTDFISQLGAGWKKHESKPELAALLEDNFIQYDGTGEVPSQIHSYLSTNHKDLRGLEKNSAALVAKAKDRWYVPDPNKAQDLEKKREKALLKEFDHYRAFTGRRLKEFRLEALRAGFRAAWGNKDYQTIVDIAKKVPDQALQEDEKLLTLYDLALTRTEADA